MNNEVLLAAYGVGAILSALLAAFFYQCGGRSLDKLALIGFDCFGEKSARVWGRLVAPGIMGLSVNGFALLMGHWHWLLLIYVVAEKCAAHMGHGGDTFWKKFFRRLIKAIVQSLPAALILFYRPEMFWLWLTQFLIACVASVILGTKNPNQAPVEELSLAFSVRFLVLFLVF